MLKMCQYHLHRYWDKVRQYVIESPKPRVEEPQFSLNGFRAPVANFIC
jgi:hypothetical protein